MISVLAGQALAPIELRLGHPSGDLGTRISSRRGPAMNWKRNWPRGSLDVALRNDYTMRSGARLGTFERTCPCDGTSTSVTSSAALPGERNSAFRKRGYGPPFSEPICNAAGRRPIASLGQRIVGRSELRVCVLAPWTGRELRIPLLASCSGGRNGWPGNGARAFTFLRAFLRRPVSCSPWPLFGLTQPTGHDVPRSGLASHR